MSKLAKEIKKALRERSGGESEHIIDAKLVHVIEVLKNAYNAECVKDMWDDVGKALAMLSEDAE